MTIRTLADIQAENKIRLRNSLAEMARALLQARDERHATIRLITHAVEECADIVGPGYFDEGTRTRIIDDAIELCVGEVQEPGGARWPWKPEGEE